MTAAEQARNISRLASKTATQAPGKAEDVATGSAEISGYSANAHGGAYSAVTGIPIIGPALAPVAAATACAAVMAYGVLSASGGLEIGAGVNPLVQLHENERILPVYSG
jgi:hypothetical protein